jgi:uncharacterized membrane protein
MQINALSEVLILVGLVLLVVWVFVRLFPPKGINAIYGYRTPRSMRDVHSWNHAQKASTRYLLSLAITYLVAGFALLFFDLSTWSAGQSMVVIGLFLILGFGALIFRVEKSLHKNFPKDKN